MLFSIIQILVTLAGIAMSIGYYPQAYKIWKLKSANEISLLNYSILSGGTLIWTFYGVMIRDIVMIVSFSISFVGAILVLSLAFRYRGEKQ